MDKNNHEFIRSNYDVLIRFFKSETDHSGLLPLHWHQSIEIIYVLTGTVTFTVDSQTFTVNPHEIFIIPSNAIHSDTHTQNQAYVIQIPLKFFHNLGINAANWEIDFRKLKHTNDLSFFTHFDHLYQIYQAKETGYVLAFYAILLILIQQLYVQNIITDRETIAVNNAQLIELIKFINVHFMEKITVNTLAERFGYNPNYLSRKFKIETGHTLISYLYSLRLKQAYQLLVGSNDSIQSIFKSVGLSNNQTTYQYFKKIYGASPLNIRNAQRKDTLQ